MRQSVVLLRCKIFVISWIAISLTSPASAQYESQSNGVTLYRDLSFSGTSQTFFNDVPDLRGSRVGNDTATSVRIGAGCRARLYADATYQGPYIEVEQDVSDLRRSPVGNDTISSLRVRCDGLSGGWGGGDAEYGVTLYRDLDFSGTRQTFSSDVSDLRGSFIGNDSATSVRVYRGCRARLYSDANYQGTHVEVDRDVPDLRSTTVGNDRITSMQVRCAGDGGDWSDGDSWNGGGGWNAGTNTVGVTLYRDLNFSGGSQSFTEDIPDLRGSYVGNDFTTSVRVSRGCRARLYTDVNYHGAYIETERDISDLRGSPVGNDTVSSLQVRCDTHGDSWTGGGAWAGGDSSWGSSHRVTLYRDTNFRGAGYSFDSDVGDLRSEFGANDEASSVRVAPGCTVRLYQDPQFRGDFTETSRDLADLRSSQVGNDSISSLQIRCQ